MAMDPEAARKWLEDRRHPPSPPPPLSSSPPPTDDDDGDDPLSGLTHCTMCGNNVSDDERGCNLGMAKGLWHHYYDLFDAGEDPMAVCHAARIWKPYSIECSQWEWWGFIYPDPDGRKGWWGMTPDGRLFVQNQLRVPKYAVLVWDIGLGKRRFTGLLEDDTEAGRTRVGIRDLMPFDDDDLMAHRSPHDGDGPHLHAV